MITTPSNTPVLRPTPLSTPNGIRIQSAVLPHYTFRTDRRTDTQTDRPTDGIGNRSVRRALTLDYIDKERRAKKAPKVIWDIPGHLISTTMAAFGWQGVLFSDVLQLLYIQMEPLSSYKPLKSADSRSTATRRTSRGTAVLTLRKNQISESFNQSSLHFRLQGPQTRAMDAAVLRATRSHPEMVGDMSRVTLNFDLSKIPLVRF